MADQYFLKQVTTPISPMDRNIHSSEFVWHLGHPFHFDLSQQTACREVRKKIEPLVRHFKNQTLLVLVRTKLINIVLIPKLIYMLECVPPHNDHLLAFLDWLVDFLKFICSLSSTIVDKALYSRHPGGIGLMYLRVSVPV